MKSLLTLLVLSLTLVSCKDDPARVAGSPQPSQGTGNGNGTLDLLPKTEDTESKDSIELFNKYMDQFDNQSFDIISDFKRFEDLNLPSQGLFIVPFAVASSDPLQGLNHIIFYYSASASTFMMNFKILSTFPDDTPEDVIQNFKFNPDVATEGYLNAALENFVRSAVPPSSPLNSDEKITPPSSDLESSTDRSSLSSSYEPYRKMETDLTRTLKVQDPKSSKTTNVPIRSSVKVFVRFDLMKNIFIKIDTLDGDNTVFITRINVGDIKYNLGDRLNKLDTSSN